MRSGRRGGRPDRASTARRCRGTQIVALLAWLSIAVWSDAARGGPGVEFLYAEAGEGGASGGHVALRVGDRVYHYQRDAAGALVIARDAWRDFEFQYRVVENRSLSASRIDLSRRAAEQLRAHLDGRFVAELAEREHHAALRGDVALLEALAAPGGGAGFSMRGAGFFDREHAPEGEAERAGRAALETLRERVERERRPGFLAARRRDAELTLRELAPDPGESAADEASALSGYAFSRRYADAFAAGLALDVLDEAPPLRRSALRVLPGAGALAEEELAALRERRDALEATLAELVASRRPDWGFAFLLAAARLAVIAESLESGRLAVLDVAPAETGRSPFAAAAEALAPHLAWRSRRIFEARSALFTDTTDERALATLEREVALHGELTAAMREGALPRRLAAPPLPEGRAEVRALPRPALAESSDGADLERAKRRVADAERARLARRSYDLVTRNCVTELFAQVEGALAQQSLARRPGSPFAFVPFMAERAVSESWPSAGPRSLPSRRRAAAQRAENDGWLASLRESNTLTSTLYTPHRGDSIFLFFTDDARYARPLLGAANLATGVVAAAVGVAWLPIDRGATFMRGLRGAAASAPELFFFNIRKGTFPFALPPPATLGGGGA